MHGYARDSAFGLFIFFSQLKFTVTGVIVHLVCFIMFDVEVDVCSSVVVAVVSVVVDIDSVVVETVVVDMVDVETSIPEVNIGLPFSSIDI